MEKSILKLLVFQPTLPARGATRRCNSDGGRGADFNPRSPHGERPNCLKSMDSPKSFQPTLPARGATSLWHPPDCVAFISTHAPRTGSDGEEQIDRVPHIDISTHAPRTGSDSRDRPDARTVRDFNPRSPHGERHAMRYALEKHIINKFQPTLPARGATLSSSQTCRSCKTFQPTLPARGATHPLQQARLSGVCNFNPRSPHGERQASVSWR